METVNLINRNDLATTECVQDFITDKEVEMVMLLSARNKIDKRRRRATTEAEKAFAYKMKLDAIKRQGERTDLTSARFGQRLTSVEKIAAESCYPLYLFVFIFLYRVNACISRSEA